MSRRIPQTSPGANYAAHKEPIDRAIARVLESGWYILGPEVERFEREFADYLGVRHAIGVSTGTDALHLALRACGIGPGDVVLTVSHTAVATASAIRMCGADPVFADIDPSSYTLDPSSLEETLRRIPSGKAKAVVPVHLYGHPADMDAIREIAERHSLRVVEDCAQSHGATYRGTRTGSLGDISAFSFYPTKNLGALGDGGIVVTGDPALAETVRLLREYGWKERQVSSIHGFNSRLDEIQAAILRVKLPHLDSENGLRETIADRYDSRLSGQEIVLPHRAPGVLHAYHQYVIRTARRDELRTHLHERGIGTGIHYPVPVHRQPAYAASPALQTPLPRTEEIAREILSLPIYPELPVADAERVAGEILSWLK